MANIYELTEEYAELQEMLEDCNEKDMQVVKDTFEGVSGEYDLKIEAYCKVIKNLEGEKIAIDVERERLESRAASLKGKIEYLKALIIESLQKLKKKSAGGDVLKAKIYKNGGKIPIIMDTYMKLYPEELPEEYRKVSYSADNEKIRKDLEAGKELAFCHLGERGEHLRIGG